MPEIQDPQPYTNVPYLPLENAEQDSRHGAHFFRNVKQLQVGFGSKVFRVDRDGMWAGSESFAGAPWSVDWDGNMIANSITISGYIPTGGALADIGAGNITGTYIGSNAITTAKIAANAITSNEIAANAVTATEINVSTLSAISANMGTVTAGTITGVTITGGTIQTSTSGYRLKMNGAENSYQFLSGSTVLAELEAAIIPDSGTAGAYLSHPTGNAYLGVSGSAGSGWSGLGGSGGFLAVTSGITTSQIETDLRVADHWLPQSSSYNLGSTSYRWGELYSNGATMYGNVNPASSGSYYLGTNDWGRLYVDRIYEGGSHQLDFTPSVGGKWQTPMGFHVRSGTPGSASSYQGYMYYDTSKANLVYSDGSGWFEVQASAY